MKFKKTAMSRHDMTISFGRGRYNAEIKKSIGTISSELYLHGILGNKLPDNVITFSSTDLI